MTVWSYDPISFYVIVIAVLGQEECPVSSKLLFKLVTSSCSCADITSDACGITLEGVVVTCKSGASKLCKDAVNGWANAYKKVPNPEACKNSAIAANEC